MKIYYDKLASQLAQPLVPCYLIYGSPYHLALDAKVQVEHHHIKNDFEIEKYYTDSLFSADSLLSSLDNYGLFSKKRLIEIHILDNKISTKIADFILEFLEGNYVDTHLIIFGNTLKGSDISSKVSKIIDSKGYIIPIYELKHWQLPNWVKAKSRQLGIKLNQSSINSIIEKLSGNTENIDQLLKKLQLNYGNQEISNDAIDINLQTSSQGSIFDLINFALLGRTSDSLKILHKLEQENSELTLLVWNIGQELHQLTILSHQLSIGVPITDITAKLNPYKKEYYLACLKRLKYQQLVSLLLRLPYIDKQSKGIADGSPWLELEQIILSLSGKQNLPAFLNLKN